MIFSVSYGSMTAHYGPVVIEADDESEAREKFNARGAFRREEYPLITARPITLGEAMRMAADRAREEV